LIYELIDANHLELICSGYDFSKKSWISVTEFGYLTGAVCVPKVLVSEC